MTIKQHKSMLVLTVKKLYTTFNVCQVYRIGVDSYRYGIRKAWHPEPGRVKHDVQVLTNA